MSRSGYPAMAKAANVSGTVQVEITIDETGNVISARAVSGQTAIESGGGRCRAAMAVFAYDSLW